MMKRWTVIALLALFSTVSFTNDAAARRRHRSGVGIHFLFALPLFYGLYNHHPHSHHDHYSYDRYRTRYMDYGDKLLLSEKTHYTLEKVHSGMEVRWLNPDTGMEGAVVARPAYKNTLEQYCRAYEQIIRYGGWIKRGVDTACRQPDGRWENISRY
jgi:hypothetical protein